MGKVIGVVSLKGGVGKTSSVVSIGASLADMGKKVLLVDGNLSAPNLGLHLDIIAPMKTIHHVLSGDEDIRNSIYEAHGMDVIPASVFHEYSDVDPMLLKSKIRELRGDYDVILLDSSPSLDNETLAVMMASDEILVVTTPDFSTLSMTLKSVREARERGTPIVGIVLNRTYNKNFELDLDDIEKTAEVPVMAVIPHDVNVVKSQAYFAPSVHTRPKSAGSLEYKKLASLLVGEKYYEPFSVASLFSRVVPKREQINRDIYYNSVFG